MYLYIDEDGLVTRSKDRIKNLGGDCCWPMVVKILPYEPPEVMSPSGQFREIPLEPTGIQ